MTRFKVKTTARAQMVDITAEVASAVLADGVPDGWVTVFVPHTTCGLTINENADPDVCRDLLMKLEKMVPREDGYRHAEGNSDAHLKAALMGFSARLPVEAGRVRLGTWQGLYLCEFDGPRTREIWVQAG